MEQDEKTGRVTATVQEIAYYNMFLTEAIFELLAEKGVLTGEEVLERVKKLKSVYGSCDCSGTTFGFLTR